MGFMSAYKHLDTICRDMNGIGVSGYIEDMERSLQGAYHVQGWDSDYRQLKHYRWVRNQIAHEMNAEEENMCTTGDVEWLEDFYQRIMNCSDPLAQYASIRRAISAKCSKPHPIHTNHEDRKSNISASNSGKHSYRRFGWVIFTLLVVLAWFVWRTFAYA